MRKIVIAFGILALLVIAALVAAPSVIDLGDLKAIVVAQIRQRTGRTVVIDGPVRFSVLSGPSITAHDLRLANPSGSALPDMVRLRVVEVKLGLWPLLAGRIEIQSAIFTDPQVDLERLPGGRTNWQLAGKEGAAHPVPPREPVTWTDLALDTLSIENGAVTLRSGNAVERFEHIGGKLSLGGPAGPFQVAGRLISHGAEISLAATGGTIQGKSMPIHVTFASKPSAQLSFDGTVGIDQGTPRFAGRVKLAAANLAALGATFLRRPVTPALAQSLVVSGELDGTPDGLTLDHLALDLGQTHAEGSLLAVANPPGLDVSLHAIRVDLDHWTGTRGTAKPAAPVVAQPATTAPIPAGAGPTVGGWSFPRNLTMNVDLGVDGILWRGDIISQAQLQAGLDHGRLSVSRLQGLLPGGTAIAATGSLAMKPGGRVLDGTLRADTDDLRTLLRWLGIDVSAVPPDRLRHAAFTGHIGAAGDKLTLSGIDAALDTTGVKGSASVSLREPFNVALTLSADRLNLDAYLAAPPRRAAPATALLAPKPGAAPRPVLFSLGDLTGFDATLDTRLGEMTWHGQPLHDLHLTGKWRDGGLSIDGLKVGDLAGAQGQLSGRIGGLASGAPTGKLAFTASGPALQRVLRIAWPTVGFDRALGAFTLGGNLGADTGKLALDATLGALGGQMKLAGTLAETAPGLNLAVAANHPDVNALLRVFLPNYRPIGGKTPLLLTAQLSGEGNAYAARDVSLTMGQAKLAGRLDLALPEPPADGNATLSLAGPLFGGALALDGDWHLDRAPPVRLHLGLQNADLGETLKTLTGVSGLSGRLDVDAALSGTGGGAGDLLSQLNGTVRLQAQDGAIAGINLAAIAGRLTASQPPADLLSLARAAAGGSTRFSTLGGSFQLQNGVAKSGDLHLAADGGVGQSSATTIDLVGRTIAARLDLHLTALPQAPPLVMQLDGPIAAPHIVFQTNALGDYLARRDQSPAAAGPSSPRR